MPTLAAAQSGAFSAFAVGAKLNNASAKKTFFMIDPVVYGGNLNRFLSFSKINIIRLSMVQKKVTPTQKTAHKATSSKKVKPLNLALQGGGAHGAFTWGALDRLFDDDSILVEAITGTSAGAMNGACIAYGLAVGGRKKAKEVLGAFWQGVATNKFGGFKPQNSFNNLTEHMQLDTSTVPLMALDYFTRIFSPYQFNPLNVNPLRDLLDGLVDFEAISQSKTLKFFVNATNVLTGKIKVFETENITLDTVMASAALPSVYKAVEIDGEFYWDGGYSGNPALFPLFYDDVCHDILIIQINPIQIKEVPVTANEIMDRINDISFNSSLLDEMRAVNFVSKLLKKEMVPAEKFSDMRLHMINAGDVTMHLSSNSKFNTDWEFLQSLHDAGYEHADKWVKKNFDMVGKDSTINIQETFL